MGIEQDQNRDLYAGDFNVRVHTMGEWSYGPFKTWPARYKNVPVKFLLVIACLGINIL